MSVLVPAWNEVHRIGACVESLLAVYWPELEILVSAGGTDGTFEVASRFASHRVRVVRQRPGQGKQAALRELLALAHGDVLYLTDGDCVVPGTTFHSIMGPIVDGSAAVVTGTYRPHCRDLTVPLVFHRWSIDRAVERRQTRRTGGITGANAAVTREALVRAGGFDPDVRTGTDYHLARRLTAAGYHVRFVDAAVETEYAKSPGAYVSRQSRWLRNTLLHGRQFHDGPEVRSAITTMAVGLGALAVPFTIPFTRRVGASLSLAILSLLMFLRLRYADAMSDEIDMPIPLQYYLTLPFLTVLDLVSWATPLFDLSRKDRRFRW